MNGDKSDKLDQWVNAYADGSLSPDQLRELKLAASKNALLRAALRSQAAIDAELKRCYEPPPAEEILNKALGPASGRAQAGSTRQDGRRWSPITRWTVIAASLALVLISGSWGAFHLFFSEPPPRKFAPPPELPYRAVEEVFARAVAHGFKPAWICKDDCQFVLTTYRRFGTGLALEKPPAGVEALGWSYSNSVSPKTAQLLGKAGDARTMVFVDKAADDRGIKLSQGSPLHLFKRTTGNLVLYELSERPEPALLNLLHIMADIPRDCLGRPVYDETPERPCE